MGKLMAPKILVTNDDGVYSTGLKAAFDSVSDLGEVTISAPAVQQSGVGRSISIFEPLRISKADIGGIPAYAVGGTPTDSVILGIFTILKGMPDLVLSGFNIGENISTDTITTSGTIGGALEAASYGVPAIAASMQVLDEGQKFDNPRDYHRERFEVGIKVVNKVARNVLRYGMPEKVDLLNINIPYHAEEDTLLLSVVAPIGKGSQEFNRLFEERAIDCGPLLQGRDPLLHGAQRLQDEGVLVHEDLSRSRSRDR